MNSHLRAVSDSPHAEEERPVIPVVWESDGGLSDDLKGVFQALRRHIWRFILVFLGVLALTAVFLSVAVPAYTGTATIIIDPRRHVITNSPEVLADLSDDSAVIDTQVQLMQSQIVVSKAADELLARYPGLKIHDPRRFTWQKRENLDFSGNGTPADNAAARKDLVDLLIGQLDVERVGLTSALTIAYKDESAAMAAEIANLIANAYIAYQADLKRSATREADQWLQQRVADLKAQMEAAEARLDEYRSRSGLMQAHGSTSTESQLANLDTGLTSAQQNLGEAQSKLDTYRDALSKAGPAEAANVVATPTMLQLRSQYTTLLDQRAQYSPTLGASYPQMVELNKQIDGVREQMVVEANRALSDLQNDVVVARSKVDAALAMRNLSRQQLVSDNAASVKLTQLQSDADSLRQMYSDTSTRLHQVTGQDDAGSVSATLVSEAEAFPDPSFPKTKLVLAAAVGGGLVLGALAVLLAQIFDGVLLRPQDLERRTQIPILALVPKLRSRDLFVGGKRIPPSEFVAEKPLSLFAESFRNLRVAVQQTSGSRESVVVQMTSGAFDEGKTICSIAFAQAAAMDGRRVLLIDADVRTRSLTRLLGVEAEAGLIELLRGKAQLRDVIRPANADRRPHFLPLSTAEVRPHDRYSSGTFEEMLQVVRRGFDLIIIDSAPILTVAESLALSRRVDAVVLVTRWAKTPVEIILKSQQEVHRAGGRIAGMLLNQVDLRKVTQQRFGRGYYPGMLRYYSQ